MFDDYYDILELRSDCNYKEVKSAYRSLALKFDPKNGAHTSFNDKFKEISEAYVVLSSPNLRKEYDRAQGYLELESNPNNIADFLFIETQIEKPLKLEVLVDSEEEQNLASGVAKIELSHPRSKEESGIWKIQTPRGSDLNETSSNYWEFLPYESEAIDYKFIFDLNLTTGSHAELFSSSSDGHENAIKFQIISIEDFATIKSVENQKGVNDFIAYPILETEVFNGFAIAVPYKNHILALNFPPYFGFSNIIQINSLNGEEGMLNLMFYLAEGINLAKEVSEDYETLIAEARRKIFRLATKFA